MCETRFHGRLGFARVGIPLDFEITFGTLKRDGASPVLSRAGSAHPLNRSGTDVVELRRGTACRPRDHAFGIPMLGCSNFVAGEEWAPGRAAGSSVDMAREVRVRGRKCVIAGCRIPNSEFQMNPDRASTRRWNGAVGLVGCAGVLGSGMWPSVFARKFIRR